MMKKMICAAAIAAMLVIGAAMSQETRKYMADRHKDRGTTCSVCHDGEAAPKTAASQKSCLVCHQSLNAVSERTNGDKGYKFNPHRNHITETNSLECTMCHQGHKADANICHNCHQGMKFK